MDSDVGGELKYVIKADIDDFNEGLTQAAKALDRMAEHMESTSASAGSDLANGIGSGAQEASNSISKFVSSSTSQLEEFAKSAASVAGNLAMTFSGMATGTFTSWATQGIFDTKFLEDTQIQMQALTHSAEDGSRAMAMATNYFKNNPFNRFDVTDATKQLIQFGASLDEVPALLEKMGNVSLSTGVAINDLARVYQRAAADGRVGLMDIEMLADRGVPIWDAFSKAVGKSASEIREETAKGGVAVEDFKKAFEYLVDPAAMEANEKTFSRQLDRMKGRLSNLKAALAGYSMDPTKGLIIDENGLYRAVTRMMKVFSDTMSGDIGTRLMDSLTRLASKISPYLDKFTEKIPMLLEKVGNAIDFVADHTEVLLPILAGAMALFGNLASGIPGLDRVLGPFGQSIGKMGKHFGKLNPLMKIFVAILGAGAFKAIKDGSLNGAFKSIGESLSKVAKALAPVVARLVELAANIGSGVLVVSLNAFAKVLEVLANVISTIPEPVLTGIVTALLGLVALQKITKPVKETTGVLSKLFNVLGKKTTAATSTAGGGIGEIIASILKPLGNKDVLKGAASAVLIGVAIGAIAVGIAKASSAEINVGNLAGMVVATGIIALLMKLMSPIAVDVGFAAIAVTLVGVSLVAMAFGLQAMSNAANGINIKNFIVMLSAMTVTVAIMALISVVAAFAAIGAIATTVVGVGLAATAWGLAEASKNASAIDMNGILLLSAAVAETSVILTALLLFSAFGAVGAIATAIIGVGLALTAAGLQSASANGKNIDMSGIQLLAAAVAETSLILTAILPLAAFGAVGAIATTIIGAGLALTAVGLKTASQDGQNIAMDGLYNLSGAIALTSSILTALLPLEAFAAVASIIDAVIAGGLVLTAKGILEASETSAKIQPANLYRLSEAITYVSELVTGNVFNNLYNMINSGLLVKTADNVKQISESLANIPQVRTSNIKKVKDAIAEFASISTGDIWNNLWNLNSSDMLTTISKNVREICETFSGIPVVSKTAVVKVKEAIEEFSRIKLTGNGLFEDKGEKSEMLVQVAENVRRLVDILSGLNSGGIEDKLNEVEKAISRDGKSWEPWYAQQFANYIKILTEDHEGIDSVNDLVSKISSWNTSGLFQTLWDFEKAISRDGKSWEPWYAQQFMSYIKELVQDSGSLDLVDGFIHKVLGWNTGSLFQTFWDLEKAISRDGKSWEPWYAEQFMSYIKKLTEGNQSLDLVNDFISKVREWATNDLLDKFNTLEKAISRDGKAWEPWYAEQFNNYINVLVGDGASFQKVSDFIGKVREWATDDLLDKFNTFENAVSRYGQGWPLWWAQQFGNYIKALTGDSGNLDAVTNFIDKVCGWATNDLLDKFNSFENAVSRYGKGWEPWYAEQFANYIAKLASVSGSLDVVSTFIDKVKSWGSEDLLTSFNNFENSVSRGGAGWPLIWAEQLVAYINKLSEATFNSEKIGDFISKIKEWTGGDVALLDVFNNFENAVSRGGQGWPLVWAEQFVTYWNKMNELQENEGLSVLTNIINTLNSIATGEEVLNKFIEVEKIISRDGAGYPIDHATWFVDYWNEFSNLSYDFSSLKTYIETVSGLSPENVLANVNAIVDSISQFVTGAAAKAPEFLAVGADFAINLAQGWMNTHAEDILLNQISNLINDLNGKVNDFKNIGTNYGNAIKDGLSGVDLSGTARTQGEAVGNGFVSGINGTIGRVNAAIGNISSAAIGTLKNLLGIASPSKVFRQLGEYTGEGFAEGLESQIKYIQNAADQISEAINNPFDTNLGALNSNIAAGGRNFNNSTTNTTINQNNIINNGADYSSMMSDLKWALFTA